MCSIMSSMSVTQIMSKLALSSVPHASRCFSPSPILHAYLSCPDNLACLGMSSSVTDSCAILQPSHCASMSKHVSAHSEIRPSIQRVFVVIDIQVCMTAECGFHGHLSAQWCMWKAYICVTEQYKPIDCISPITLMGHFAPHMNC